VVGYDIENNCKQRHLFFSQFMSLQTKRMHTLFGQIALGDQRWSTFYDGQTTNESIKKKNNKMVVKETTRAKIRA